MNFSPHAPIKVRLPDLIRLGIVTSREQLKTAIRTGRLRKPHKDGTHRQAAAWWYWQDIVADLEREKAELERRGS